MIQKIKQKIKKVKMLYSMWQAKRELEKHGNDMFAQEMEEGIEEVWNDEE